MSGATKADAARQAAKRSAARGLARQRAARDEAVARQVASTTTQIMTAVVEGVTDGHATVRWMDAVIEVDRLEQYQPVVGDAVALAVTGTDLLVLGKRVSWPDQEGT